MPKLNPLKFVQQVVSTATLGIVPPPSGGSVPFNILRPKDSQLLQGDFVGAAINAGSVGTIPATQDALGLSADQKKLVNLGIGAGATLGVASSVLASGASSTALAPADVARSTLPAAFAALPRGGGGSPEPIAQPVTTLPVLLRDDNALLILGGGGLLLVLVVILATRPN